MLPWIVLLAACIAARGSAEDTAAPLVQVAAIALPNVEGRIDHLAIDLQGKRLFVCALGSNELEVVGLDSGSVIHRIGGLSEPQGVCYVPEADQIYITNAGSGECDVYDGTSYELLKRIDLGADADNIHSDPATHRLFVSAGDRISVIDSATETVTGSASLPGHPEGFVLEQHGTRAFVNVPFPSRSVFVIDRAAPAVAAQWPLGRLLSDAFSNFPIALDEASRRLFVGTRAPASLKVLDTATGRAVAELRIDGDADDIFFDSGRRRIYVSCGQGHLDVFQQADPDHYRLTSRLATGAGGRTSLWVAEMDRLFVALPRKGGREAEILVYGGRG